MFIDFLFVLNIFIRKTYLGPITGLEISGDHEMYETQEVCEHDNDRQHRRQGDEPPGVVVPERHAHTRLPSIKMVTTTKSAIG